MTSDRYLNELPIRLTVNGVEYERTVPARRLLVHLLRDDLGLTGTHVGCDTGNCGACTLIWNGKLIKSCMMLACQADGSEILTVEGLGSPTGELEPIQQAFSEHHALQCGYCTPGMMLSAKFLLERNSRPSEDQIRQAIEGNVCRCTGYVNIVRAIKAASELAAGSRTS